MQRKIKILKNLKSFMFLGILFLTPCFTYANTVSYFLDNVIQDNNRQMTGVFQWTYAEGDFENGSGLFTELFIPGHGTDINALTITFDISKSIEFSLTANIHGGGVNVSLFLDNALTPTQGSILDFNRSSYEIESGSQRGGFVSGAITPQVVPLPTAVWMFLSAFAGLLVVCRQNAIVDRFR